MEVLPITTLFLLISVDGKISTGSTDNMDMDKDLPQIKGIREGLHQYYEIEETTDLFSFNTGRVQAKIGANERKFPDHRNSLTFVLLDNTHLSEHGIQYFCHYCKDLILITSNKNHIAFHVKSDNLHIIYQEKQDLKEALSILHNQFHCERLTIQSGGTLNKLFLKEKLIDYVDIVVAPCLIGGRNTSTLVDGDSLTLQDQLDEIGVLKLISATTLENSYLRLKYQVIR